MRLRLTPAPLARLLILLLVLLPLGLLRPEADQARAGPEQTFRLYLPALLRDQPQQPSVFGAEINHGAALVVAKKGRVANLYWTRYNGILWSEIEATQGVRDWSKAAGREAQLRAMVNAGLTPIVVVRGTPGWAQLIPGAACGPVRPEALDAYASFMGELVARYSKHPYNIRYWELGNEPDVSLAQLNGNGNSIFGCWGLESESYFGGGYYAEMLKRVYPAIKQADPRAKVLIGGLLLDCDPANLPPGRTDCNSADFLEGILQNGGGNYFDMVSYHGYTFWGSVNLDWDKNYPGWSVRGGAVLGKLSFIREVMGRYGVVKPILLTETGLLCHESTVCPSASLEEDKANYANRLYARAAAQGLEAAIWFTLDGPGWRDGALLDASQNPRPVFTTIYFLSSRLAGATFLGSDSLGSREGYIFQKGNRLYRLYWTNDDSTTTVSLPPGSLVYDKFGRQLFPVGDTMPVGFDPVLIESSH